METIFILLGVLYFIIKGTFTYMATYFVIKILNSYGNTYKSKKIWAITLVITIALLL